jgi:hypothetical protein
MILLDTNIVSEVSKPHPNAGVIAWLDAQAAVSLFLCAPVLAELHYGVERLPPGSRQQRLRGWVERLENDFYLGRILPLDAAAAVEFGRLAVKRERLGRRLEPMDALIAAVAIANRMALATRDADDFAGLGFDVINPFEYAPPSLT